MLHNIIMRSLVNIFSLRFSHGTDYIKLSCNDYTSAHIANFLFLVNWAHRIKNDLPCFCTHNPTRNRFLVCIYYITFSNYTITLFMVTLTLDFSFSFIFMTIILSLHKHLVKVSTLKRYIL